MKICPNCKAAFPDDANFCPQEACATPNGPRRLQAPAAAEPAARFKMVGRLGGGSTGEVWKAIDNQAGSEVAYKIIAQDIVPNEMLLARAEREFKQLVRVRHPNIASIMDCSRTSDGRLAIGIELVDGQPLNKILASGPLSFENAKSVVAQIGQALLEAQKTGLVHRDVAPKNVLVSSSGAVKVTNFPVAKPILEGIAGVVAYMSPEQGQGKPIDQRSNTYSLAAIFYHLLVGEPPFQGATPQAVIDLHVGSPALAPSQRRPEAGLTPDVDRVILKALDKSPSRRHLTLRLFLSEVEALTLTGSGPSPSGMTASTQSGSGKASGYAKTMLFAGGQAEVANMVAKAIAARGGGGTPAPVTVPVSTPAAPVKIPVAVAPPAAAPPPRAVTPSPVVAPAAPRPAPAPVAARPAPSPVAARPAPVPAARPPAPAVPVQAASVGAPAAPAGGGKPGGKFRETLWFKKGDVEQMVADAKAKTAAAGGKAPVNEAEIAQAVTADERPIEDRYVDDGSVTTDDRKKFSLRTGGTATAMPAVVRAIPGERMSEEEMADEFGNKKRNFILIAVVVVVIAVVAVVMSSGKKSPEGGKHEGGEAKTATHAEGNTPPGEAVKAAATAVAAAPAPAAAKETAAPARPAAHASKPKAGGSRRKDDRRRHR